MLVSNGFQNAHRFFQPAELGRLQALHFLPLQSDGAVYGAAAYACQESGEWRETVRLLQMLKDSWRLAPFCRLAT